MSAPQIVVIGLGIGGAAFINAAAPTLSTSQFTVLDPSTEFLWPIAAVRGFVDHDMEQKMLRPTTDMAKKYKNVKVVKTRATAIDARAKTVQTQDGQTIPYDFLIIACGSSNSAPWKKSEEEHDPSQALRQQYVGYQSAVKTAKTVVISGAGPVGIESAAEVKITYPQARVILVNRLLSKGGWPAGVANSLAGQLKNIGVEVCNDLKTTSPTDSSSSPVSVRLSDGTEIRADVFLSCAGVRPNSSFLPPAMLDDKRWLKTSPDLRSEQHKEIFVVGDAANFTKKFAYIAEQQGGIAAANVITLSRDPKATNLKTYSDQGMWLGMVQIGTKGGSGSAGWIRFPSFFIPTIKGKTLFTAKIDSFF